MIGRLLFAIVGLLSVAPETLAFAPPSSPVSRASTIGSSTARFAKAKAARPPTFNKEAQLWEPSPDTEEEAWDAFGSFLRGGPPPFLVRVFSPQDYEQAVFKYMAGEKCSRAEAQGNMDSYFANAADWAYQKSEEKRGMPKVDYTLLKPQQAVLVLSWAFFVTPFLVRCAFLIATTETGWGITLDQIMDFSS